MMEDSTVNAISSVSSMPDNLDADLEFGSWIM